MFIVPISATEAPVELTAGDHGAIHGPVFNTQGTKVAWLELDEDGYETDRYAKQNVIWSLVFTNLPSAKIVIYDLQKNVRFTITQAWDRSPDSLAISCFVTFCYTLLSYLPFIVLQRRYLHLSHRWR